MPNTSVVTAPVSTQQLKHGFDTLANLLALTLGPACGSILTNVENKTLEMPYDAAAIAVAPINSVLSLGGMDLVGTAGGVLSVERNKAKDFSQGMEGVPIVSLQKLGRKIFALSADGMVWEKRG